MAKGISIMQEEGKEKGLAALVPPKKHGHFRLLIYFLAEFPKASGRVPDFSWSMISYIPHLNVAGWRDKNVIPEIITKVFNAI